MEELTNNTPIEEPAEQVQTEQVEETDWKAEAEKWKAHARKWESRAKAEADTANADELAATKALLEQAEKELDGLKAATAKEAWKNEASAATGVPANLLRGDTEEEIKAHAEAIQQAISSAKPNRLVVPDSGEPHKIEVSKEQILAIKNEKERLAAIREHIELFEN